MLRIGDRDSETGMYWVIDNTGAVLGLGKKEFDEQARPGDRIVGQKRADGIWVLIGRDGGTAEVEDRARQLRIARAEEQPIYRALDKFNTPLPPEGDYDQLRVSLTNQNLSFGGYTPDAPPPQAAPIHCDIKIGDRPLLTIDYPGVAEAPAPIIYNDSQPIAWLWGEREPATLFAWRRITLVISLGGAKAAGLGGTRSMPLEIEIRHNLQAGEEVFYPGVPTSSSQPRRGAPRSIWRVGFSRKIDGRYIAVPAQRSPEYLDLFSGNSTLNWHQGLPARLGRPPQAHAYSSFRYQEGFQDAFHAGGSTIGVEISRFKLKYPMYSTDTLLPSSVPSGRGFLIDYRSLPGFMLPENPELFRQLGIPFPNFGTPDFRTIRTVPLPRPRGKPPQDPAFASNFRRRYPEIHTFPNP
jgi:hypothetical protein